MTAEQAAFWAANAGNMAPVGAGLAEGAAVAGAAGAGGAGGAGGTTAATGGMTAPQTAAAGSWIPGVSNATTLSLGANALSGVLAANANSKARDAITGAGREANELQRYMYDTTRADNAPWRAAGESALAKLTGLLNDGSLTSRFAGKLDNEAGYQFARDEGMKAINNRADAGGGMGGDVLKAGIRFAQGNANQFYNDSFNRWDRENTGIFNRLSGVAGTGQEINAANAAAGRSYVDATGRNLLGMGSAQAAAGINQGNIYGNMLNQGVAQWNRAQYDPDAINPATGRPYRDG